MSEELPATPGATFTQPTGVVTEPLVIIEIDRRAATLDGIETHTCVQCGETRANAHGTLRIPGRFSSLSLRVGLCDPCQEKATAAYGKVARLHRFLSGLSIAQLSALVFTMASGGGGLLFSSLSLLLVGTMGVSFVTRRRWLREQPRLLELGATSVRLRVPHSWQRVLSDERPRVLVGAAEPPRLPTPAAEPGPGPGSR